MSRLVDRIILGVAALVLIAIGFSATFTTVAFDAGYDIQVTGSPELASELRALGMALLLLGLAIAVAVVRVAWVFPAAVATAAVALGLAVGRAEPAARRLNALWGEERTDRFDDGLGRFEWYEVTRAVDELEPRIREPSASRSPQCRRSPCWRCTTRCSAETRPAERTRRPGRRSTRLSSTTDPGSTPTRGG
jgi:hypothetical protein